MALSESDKAIIHEEIVTNGQQFNAIGPYSVLVRGEGLLKVQAVDEAEAEALAEEARALGFAADVQRMVSLSTTADRVMYLVVVATAVWEGLKGTNAVLKALNELPENWSKLLSKFRGKNKDLALHEAFSFEAVNKWLDQKYGPRNWRYDPDAVKSTVAAGMFVLFIVPEEIHDKRHLLRVRDEEVEELPADWVP